MSTSSDVTHQDPPKGFESWRQSLANFTGLGLSDSERIARNEENERKRAERDWDRCERLKNEVMTTSPAVVFMLNHLKLSGCEFKPDNLACWPCDETRGGGFAHDYGILLCQNRIMSKKHLEETMTHELIHAFDHCRFKVDWENLRHQACSEIRASNLSGECRFGREVDRRIFGFNKQHQECVKRRAILSVSMNPKCKDREQATQVVNQVWDSCWKDTRPFDSIYK